MSASANEILKLRDAYREARTQIVANSDPIEREVGLAALRLEATHTYREAMTSQASCGAPRRSGDRAGTRKETCRRKQHPPTRTADPPRRTVGRMTDMANVARRQSQ